MIDAVSDLANEKIAPLYVEVPDAVQFLTIFL